MDFLHTMVRINNIEDSLRFYCQGLGLKELRRIDNEGGRFTLIFLATEADINRAHLTGKESGFVAGLPMLELTYNWPSEETEAYVGGRNFGHLAYQTDDIYKKCQHLMDMGYIINRPPHDGRMAFVRSPDGISVELLQKGSPLAAQAPWKSMKNTGEW
jgi:lactoylglutathione lyase